MQKTFFRRSNNEWVNHNKSKKLSDNILIKIVWKHKVNMKASENKIIIEFIVI